MEKALKECIYIRISNRDCSCQFHYSHWPPCYLLFIVKIVSRILAIQTIFFPNILTGNNSNKAYGTV